MGPRKMVLMKLFAQLQWRCKHRLMDTRGEGEGVMNIRRRGWDEWREA